MSKELIRPEQFCNIKSSNNDQDINLELSEQQLQELSELYEGMFDTFQAGKVVTGTVVQIDSDGVLVDIKYKSRGIVPKYEFGEHELKKFKIGQEIEVMLDELENSEGTVVLSYEKAKALKSWQAVVKLFEEGKPVEGVVTHKVKGGLNVDIGIPAFLPGSQIDLQRVVDFDQFIGQTITANILKINQKRGNVIISRRKYLGDQRIDSRKKVLEKLSVGEVIQGTVKNITNYGAFIDIGGVDGLLHITDMTWGRISHPSKLLKLGETITVKVLSFDQDNQKISLGIKQLDENPWADVDDKLKVGQKIKGKVSSITDYGLFVEVAKGIEGLVHISEISWTDRINNLMQRYTVGDDIDVVVVSLDKENRRMSLSIKQLKENPWETIDKKFKEGEKIKGQISNITDFGIFVQLMPGIDGLVHISDLSWTEHIDHPRDRYTIGDEVEAVVLGVDKENKKVSLSIKHLTKDPWESVELDYPIDSIVNGDVSKLTNFGAFIKLPTGIEGLVHNTTALEDQGKKANEIFTVGQKVQLRVLNVNKEERKLGLTTKLEKVVQEKKEAAPTVPAAESTHAQTVKKAPRKMPAPAAPVAPAAAAPKQERAQAAPTKQANVHGSAPKQEKAEARDHVVSSSSPTSKIKSSFQMALEDAMQKNEDKSKK